MTIDANTARGERILAESKAMNAAAYNARYAAAREQNAALAKLRAETLAAVAAQVGARRGSAQPQVEVSKRAHQDDDSLPERWLD